MPSVCIILLNYNGIEDTIACIESLKEITYTRYEIVIVDNASTDGSEGILKQRYSFPVIQTGKNLGFAGGNNAGIRYALENGADYIVLLNNDTVVDKGFLEPLVETAETYKNAGVVGGKIYYYDSTNTLWFAGGRINRITGKTKQIGKNKADTGGFDTQREVGFITGCLMLVSAAAIRAAGLMDEGYFLYFEDTDWCERIRRAGYKIVFTPLSVIYHKESSSTRKMSHVKMYYYDRNRAYFIRKNLGGIFKITAGLYLKLYLILKAAKSLMFFNVKKFRMICVTSASIKKGEMGPYRGPRI